MSVTANSPLRAVVQENIQAVVHGISFSGDSPIEWCVSGDLECGVFASYKDFEDIIEFGLLARDGDSATNLLHATLVLTDADNGELICSSEELAALNFSAFVTSNSCQRLNEPLRFFLLRLNNQDQ